MYYPITTEKWDWMAPEYRKDYIVSRTAPPSQLQLGGMGEGTSDRSVGAGAGATTDDLLLRHQHQSHHHQRPSTAPHHARIGSSSSGSGGRYEEGGSGSGSDSPTGTIRSKASLRSPAKLRSQSLRSTNRGDMTGPFDDMYSHSGTGGHSLSQVSNQSYSYHPKHCL